MFNFLHFLFRISCMIWTVMGSLLVIATVIVSAILASSWMNGSDSGNVFKDKAKNWNHFEIKQNNVKKRNLVSMYTYHSIFGIESGPHVLRSKSEKKVNPRSSDKIIEILSRKKLISSTPAIRCIAHMYENMYIYRTIYKLTRKSMMKTNIR